MKTHIVMFFAACVLLSACNSASSHMSSSRSGSGGSASTYGEATENPHERYGGRQLGPHPGAAAYDPSQDR